MKILVVEDLFFQAIYLKFILDENFRKVTVDNFNNNYQDTIYPGSININGEYSVELSSVLSNESFDTISEEKLLEYDLIILDYQLLDGNSLKILESIKKINFKGNIIANSDRPCNNKELLKKGCHYSNDKGKESVIKIVADILKQEKSA